MYKLPKMGRIRATIPDELIRDMRKYGIFDDFDNILAKLLYNEILRRKEGDRENEARKVLK